MKTKWTPDKLEEESKKYKTKKAFKIGSRYAYNIAKKEGLLSTYTWFQERSILDQESCRNEALKYKSTRDFRISSKHAYYYALHNGLLESYTWLDQGQLNEIDPTRFWTYEKCYNEARKFKTDSEFQNQSPQAFEVAKIERWLSEYKWMSISKQNNQRKSPGYWTYEQCEIRAKLCKTSKELKDLHPLVYSLSTQNGWMKEYYWLQNTQRSRGYWNKEHCFEAARECKTLKEFRTRFSGAYGVSSKNKWIKDFVWLEDGRIKSITDPIDCVYAYEFVDQNAVYVGRTLMRLQKRRDSEHIFDERDAVYIFAKENNISIPSPIYIKENISIKESRELECFWIEEYRRMGWNVLNKKPGGSIGAIGFLFTKYSYDECYKEAEKYKTKKDFRLFNQKIYNFSKKRGWIQDYTWLL